MDYKNVSKALQENDEETLQVLLQNFSERLKTLNFLSSNMQHALVSHQRDRNAEFYIPKHVTDTKEAFALKLV